MKKALRVTSIALLLVSLAWADASAAPDLRNTVKLTGDHGNVTFRTPEWRTPKTETGKATAVLERAPDKAKKISFGLLVLAIEEGPDTNDDVDWEKVRKNIVGGAKASGSELSLKVGAPFTAPSGLVGRRLSGTTMVGERTVKVEMVALLAPKILMTVSSVGRMDDVGVAELATAVATTASVNPEP